MVLTFTLSLSATGTDREDVQAVLLGALGCNLAWGLIDAAMYLMGVRAERSLAAYSVKAIRAAGSPAEAQAIIADRLPPSILPALLPADFERIRLHLISLPVEGLKPRIASGDYLAAVGVFLLVTLCLLPVAIPFLLIDDIPVALQLSNAVAILLMFLAGFAFGRQIRQPWRVGFSMVTIGVVLVAFALILGG